MEELTKTKKEKVKWGTNRYGMPQTEQHQAITDFLRDYHSSGGFISPVLFRRLSELGLASYINNLPGKSPEEDITLALAKYDSHLERLAIAKADREEKTSKPLVPEAPPAPQIILGPLNKKTIASFLQWSSTRYNNYLGYGTKQENVNLVFNALKAGHLNGKTVFTIRCGFRSW